MTDDGTNGQDRDSYTDDQDRKSYTVPDELELEPSGQLSIGVDGEQRAFAGLAPERKPAPLTFERDAGATEELERRASSRSSSSNVRKHPCALCGRLAVAEELCYSRHTNQRYCPLTDAEACRRRQVKRERAEAN